jgi:hypothetical protein
LIDIVRYSRVLQTGTDKQTSHHSFGTELDRQIESSGVTVDGGCFNDFNLGIQQADMTREKAAHHQGMTSGERSLNPFLFPLRATSFASVSQLIFWPCVSDVPPWNLSAMHWRRTAIVSFHRTRIYLGRPSRKIQMRSCPTPRLRNLHCRGDHHNVPRVDR